MSDDVLLSLLGMHRNGVRTMAVYCTVLFSTIVFSNGSRFLGSLQDDARHNFLNYLFTNVPVVHFCR